jgi:hypothetical protein
MPATMRWLGLALLGIAIAAGVSIAASRLASQQIGLASQPISAGDALAPAVSRENPRHRHSRRQPAHHQTSTEPSTTPGTPPTSSEPPSTAPATAPPESSHSPGGHDGEQNAGGGGGGADD